jgi:hypothetical protein
VLTYPEKGAHKFWQTQVLGSPIKFIKSVCVLPHDVRFRRTQGKHYRVTHFGYRGPNYSQSLTYAYLGRAVAQAVSRWARVRVLAACGVCDGQSGAGAGFLRVLRFPLPIIPPISPSS